MLDHAQKSGSKVSYVTLEAASVHPIGAFGTVRRISASTEYKPLSLKNPQTLGRQMGCTRGRILNLLHATDEPFFFLFLSSKLALVVT